MGSHHVSGVGGVGHAQVRTAGAQLWTRVSLGPFSLGAFIFRSCSFPPECLYLPMPATSDHFSRPLLKVRIAVEFPRMVPSSVGHSHCASTALDFPTLASCGSILESVAPQGWDLLRTEAAVPPHSVHLVAQPRGDVQ